MTRHLKTTVAALALSLIGTAALAQDTGALTRDQVRAELAAARANGTLNPFDTLAYMQPQQRHGDAAASLLAHVREAAQRIANAQPDSGLTRAQVKAELAAARRSGQMNPFDNDDDISYHAAPRVMVAPSAIAQVR